MTVYRYSVVNNESLDASGVVKALGGSEDQAALAAKKADEAVDKWGSPRVFALIMCSSLIMLVLLSPYFAHRCDRTLVVFNGYCCL